MKFHSKLTAIGSIAAFAASPLAFANNEAPVKAETAEVQDAEPEVIISPETPDSGDVVVVEDGSSDASEGTGDSGPGVSDETSEEVVIDDTVVDTEGGRPDAEVSDPVEEGGVVPIDWVKRGDGENPDVMFQNTAGGEAPVFKGETAMKGLGQDEKATAIEAHDAPMASQVNREKKVPVALIKKGRIFLR